MVLGSTTITIPPLFSVSQGGSISDLYNSGLVPIALLVGFFSGAWPYLKLACLLYCWCSSRKRLSIARRENILMALDALGKWAFVDVYMLVLLMVCFRFIIKSKSTGIALAEVYVEPLWGFHAFLYAAIISLVLSHAVLYYHRQAMQHEQSGFNSDGSLKITPFESTSKANIVESLSMHVFTAFDKKTKNTVTFGFTKIGRILVVVCLLVSIVFLGLGLSQLAFEVNFTGALSQVLDDIGIPVRRAYSTIDLGMVFPNSEIHPNSPEIYTDQAVYFISLLAFPLLNYILMIVLWLLPMKILRQKTLFAIVEVLFCFIIFDYCRLLMPFRV